MATSEAPSLSISDVDDKIRSLQNALPLISRSNPARATCLRALGMARSVRYHLSHEKDDLDKSVLHFVEAILLPYLRSKTSSENIVNSFFYLASALRRRSEEYERHEDVDHSIEYFRHLRRLPLDAFDISLSKVSLSLVLVLASRVEVEAGDSMRDMEEMVALCRELLTSGVSASYPKGAIMALNGVVLTKFCRGEPIKLLEEVIVCFWEAFKICPPGPDTPVVSMVLGNSLAIRFITTHSRDDYEESTALLDDVVTSPYLGDNTSQIQDQAAGLVTLVALLRSTLYENPEYLEEASSRCRTLLGSSLGNSFRPTFTKALAYHAEERFKHFGLTEGLQEARSRVSEVMGLSSSQCQGTSTQNTDGMKVFRETFSLTELEEKILDLKELLSTTEPGTVHHKGCLENIVNYYETKFSRTGTKTDIKELVKYRRMLLASTQLDDPLKFLPLESLGRVLLTAFELTNKIEYLEESIALHRDILKLPSAQALHFTIIRRLISSLSTRLRLVHHKQDLEDIIQLMPIAVHDKYARVPDRFQLSCLWAYVARIARHPSVSTAYESAMTLMQSSLFFAPTLQIQHVRLVAMRGVCEKMPLDYASYQVYSGLFEKAIETLERGRALLWSEMRGLRSSINKSLVVDSPLAVRFAAINQELEDLTMSASPNEIGGTDRGAGQSGDGLDPFGRLVVKQRKLLEEREKLLPQIQELPGFEEILKTPSFDTLRSAASRGPVIIINHCKLRSDILILLPNSSFPSFIPAAEDFYDRANELRDQLVSAMRQGLDSEMYQRALRSVLEGLYELVGRPVIQRLRVMKVPEQSRVWWCPTSVFCSLPLHAMGPIPSSHNSRQYFSDLYIPSYIPSLSALIESRTPGSQTLDRPSLLLVAQPDASLPGVWGEMEVIQSLNTRVTSLFLGTATSTSVIEGLRDHQFAHFACHGMLETGKPFDASFELHGNSRLTLLNIVRSRLPTAEFAFLSACHTAELTEESIADEVLHLTAAMQYCGFRSVVGTMWAMADTDGRDLAAYFYKSLFSGRESGIPYYERSARALRDAVRKLRRKSGITLERWVNFVHYGA
ncbi:CHAT domain-containing protein [Lactarius psammicola]|nr:CHAT domain-containing protein [Lactarius psammicola]